MEIRGEPNPRRLAQARSDDAAADALRRARERNRDAVQPEAREAAGSERVQAARQEAARRKEARLSAAGAEGSGGIDRLELSSGARAVLEPGAGGATDPGQLARLRALIAEGGLFTPERIEQAARKLLAGDV